MKPIDFYSVQPPTQEQFNEYHKEPVDYGEDGEQLLGKQYTKEQAVKIFSDHWKMLSGEEPDFNIEESVVEGVYGGWTTQPDKYEDGDFCFVMIWQDTSETKARYEAWRLMV